MNLAKQATYNGLQFDFFEEGRNEIFMTIEQLAIGFGYKSKKGIERMLDRNPYLKGKAYSFLTKVYHATGGTQETRVFTRRGIYEIGSLSRTKEGREFRSWCYDYIAMLEKALLRAAVKHVESKDLQKQLHEAVQESSYYKDIDQGKKRFTFMNINKLMARTASHGRVKKKEELEAEEFKTYERLIHKAIVALNEGRSYEDIKNDLVPLTH